MNEQVANIYFNSCQPQLNAPQLTVGPFGERDNVSLKTHKLWDKFRRK